MTGLIDTILNPVFGWLLNIPPLLALFIISFLLGLISTLLQKYFTDQAKMKRLKDDTKKFQNQMKEAQKAKDQEKMLKVQQKMLPLQMELMKESFKPLFITIIPFLIIFFWLANHFAFHPILPNTPFVVTAVFEEGIGGNATLAAPAELQLAAPVQTIQDHRANWTLSGPAGEYELKLSAAAGAVDVSRKVLITTEPAYIQPKMPLKGLVTEFSVNNQKLAPWPSFWVPWSNHQAGWIFWYILFSIPISLGLKKALRVV